MPLSVDNILQSNTGGFEGSSGAATLSTGTTAGSTVLIFVGIGTPGGSDYWMRAPSGFTVLTNWFPGFINAEKTAPWVYAKRNVSADETSWTMNENTSKTVQAAWVAMEITGIEANLLNAFFVADSGESLTYNAAASSIGSGSTPVSSCYDVLAFAVHSARSDTTTVPTWSGQNNGFTEFAESSTVNANNAVSIAVSYKPSLALSSYTCTASLSPTSPAAGTVVGLFAEGARHAPNMDVIFGAETGTASGLTTGIADHPGGTFHNRSAPVQVSTGSPEISSTFARTGSYSVKLSSSAAAEWVSWTNDGALGKQENYTADTNFPLIGRLCFYMPSLPAGDVEICSAWSGGTASVAKFWYRTASQKIGCVVGDPISPSFGTEILSDATVSAGVWIGLDFRYDPRVAIPVCDWQVDYDSLDVTGPVAQTQAAGVTGSIQNVSEFVIGWKTAATATIYYDDIAACKQWGAYPLGDLRIRLLKPDQAGTATVSGTSTNFKTFTSNGTMATWSSAATLANLDDAPPTIGGSADGLAQVAVATSDYVEIPMENWTAAPDNTIRGARWYLAGWAASGNPASIGVKWYDGTTEYFFIAVGDHGFDDTATVWMVGMVRSATTKDYYDIDQTKLNGLAARVGYSDDANPDAGVHCLLLEVAYQPATTYGIYESGDGFTLYVRQDPVTAGVASYLVTTPSGSRGATFTHALDGVDQTPVYVGPNTAYEHSIGASSISTVTSVGLAPDPG